MRIVIDLQGAQGSASDRGIGRYSLSLAHAIARNRGPHEILLALNGLFPESIEPIRANFDAILPQDNIRVWHASGPVNHDIPSNVWRRKAAELVRESFLASLRPDVVHLSSLFEGWGWSDNSVTSIGLLSDATPCSVTLYDLIPLMKRREYLRTAALESWYENKLDQLRRADLLLAISESSKREALKHLGFPDDKVVNVGTAADPKFKKLTVTADHAERVRQRYGLAHRFVMYTGGTDHRKNVEGLICAYALLPSEIRAGHQLAIVCSVSDETREQIKRLTMNAGMSLKDVALTGFVPEDDLVILYNICTAFVFPSLHEGFGLPALEAMSCGAPVIAANTSSLPEVVGRADALFDPLDLGDIANKLFLILTDDGYRASLSAHGLRQALNFSWDDIAKRTNRSFESLPNIASNRSAAMPRRPALAYIPMARSDANYVADFGRYLLPELSRHYRIDVIFGQETLWDPWIKENCRLRSSEWFSHNSGKYDRILYSVGPRSSPLELFDVGELTPGVVILHSEYESNFEALAERSEPPQLGYVRRAIIESHVSRNPGTSKIQQDVQLVPPFDPSLLEGMRGVIVHSACTRRAAAKWWGERVTEDWLVHPLPRSRLVDADKLAVRHQLGIAPDSFVVCCFSSGTPEVDQKVFQAWHASKLGESRQCHLIFLTRLRACVQNINIESFSFENACTDRVTFEAQGDYRRLNNYIIAMDICVYPSPRGYTAAALDCLTHGVPTIMNCGAGHELAKVAIYRIAEHFHPSELIEALEVLWSNPSKREALGSSARLYIEKHHSPRACADSYAQSIESFYKDASTDTFALTRAVADLDGPENHAEEYAALARAVVLNKPAREETQILVDVSELVERDARSGIQRVVRSVLAALLGEPPSGCRIEPVYASSAEVGYRYARTFTLSLLGHSCEYITDAPVEFASGDIFLGLDFQPQVVPNQARYLSWIRNLGVHVYFVVYDVLQLLLPGAFPEGAAAVFLNWFRTISNADGLICISKAVAEEVADLVAVSRSERFRPIKIGWFHLGADMAASMPTKGVPIEVNDVLAALSARPTFLMVGTIEPRKGHSQALSAFEILWEDKIDINIVLVGRQGWMVDKLADLLNSHPENNKKLFWLKGISDEYLERVYSASDCLIAASEGEGFGLPLIEAAQHALPIIARDIPVFREVARSHAYYFSGSEPSDLAESIRRWLKLKQSESVPGSTGIGWSSWTQSTTQLINVIRKEEWMTSWVHDNAVRYFAADERLGSVVGLRKGLSLSTSGQAGWLLYGPYMPLPSGTYIVLLMGSVTRLAGPVIYADVASKGGTLVHATADIEPVENGLIAELLVKLVEAVTDLEVRLWVQTETEMSLSRLEIFCKTN